MQRKSHVRYETYCLFCGKTWSVALGSPTLACSCGANINVLKDLSSKSAQELELKVFNVLMQTWQEKMGETRRKEVPPPVDLTTESSNNVPPEPEIVIEEKEMKTTLIVQCPKCNVNVIVPDVKLFQCGACGQYMTIEKQLQNSTIDMERHPDLSSLTNLSNNSSSFSSSSSSSNIMAPS